MMGADLVKTALMVAYGNCWTNMAQPFWAIALLGITGLKAKDIMGYSIGIMILSGFIFSQPRCYEIGVAIHQNRW